MAENDAVVTAKDPKPVVGKNIFQRMVEAKKRIGNIPKTPKGPGLQYNYTSYDSVVQYVSPILDEVGILAMPYITSQAQNGNRTELCGGVKFVNIDNPEDHISVDGVGYGVDNQDKGPGKAYSYLVKQCLLKAFLLQAGEREEVDAYQGQEATHQPAEAPTISGAQAQTLQELIQEAQANVPAFMKALSAKVKYRVDTLLDLKDQDFSTAVNMLEGKIRTNEQQKRSRDEDFINS